MTQRDIKKIDKTILDNFYKLVHSQTNIRLTAASSTYKILNGMLKRSPDTFNENLNYCIDRLVAGLASSRALARQGYGILLLEILKSHQVSTDRLLTIAQQKFGHISRETQRDNLIGYFLLISIILESGNYKRSKTNTQCLEKIYKHLTHLHNIKSYLEYSVCKALVENYDLFHPYMLADIPPGAFGSDSRISSTDLLIVILCNKKEPVRGLLNMDNASLTNLYSVLLDDKFQKRPLHPVFLEVGKFVMTHFPQQFQTFYTNVIFSTFFKANHNELAAMGLELTASLIESTEDVETVKVLLSDHIVRTLILSLRKRNSLQTHCVKFFNTLKEQFKSVSDDRKSLMAEKQYTILLKLTSSPGSIAFDEDSKSSSINDLLHNCNPKALKKYLDRLMVLQGKPMKDERLLQSCARQMSFIVRRPQLVEDHAIMVKVVKFLLADSMNVTNTHGPDTQSQLEHVKLIAYKAAYHSTLDHVISVSNASQRIEHLEELVDYSEDIIKATNEENRDESLIDLWSVYMLGLKGHKKLIKKYLKSKQLYPITTLYLFYGLQVIEHRLDCKTYLEELDQASHDAVEGDPADGSWADVLTDQIIAILSATECSAWIRNLCESVFGSLIPHISQTSIDLICDAIRKPPSEDDEDGSEFENENDDENGDAAMEDEEVSDDDDEDMSVDEEQSSVEGNESSPELSESGDQEKQVEEAEDAKNEVHDDEGEEEEEYLTDKQMIKYDSVIAEMFKTKKSKKADNSAFRLRCLDLAKKVLVKRPNDVEAVQTILTTMIPLARKKSTISDKITTILSKMPNKSKYPNVVDFLEKKKGVVGLGVSSKGSGKGKSSRKSKTNNAVRTKKTKVKRRKSTVVAKKKK